VRYIKADFGVLATLELPPIEAPCVEESPSLVAIGIPCDDGATKPCPSAT